MHGLITRLARGDHRTPLRRFSSAMWAAVSSAGDAATDPALADARAEVVAGWIMIGDQDKPLVEQVHRNHKSRGRAGIDTVFSPFWEGAVQHFQKTVASYLVD